MKRDIQFRAFYVAGPNQEIKAMIEGVSVYGLGHAEYNIGINNDAFNEEIFEQTGFKPDSDYDVYSKDDVKIDLTAFGCYDGEEWKFFKGELMQSTGLKDSEGKAIWEDDILEYTFIDDDQADLAQVVFEEGAWCSKSLKGSPEYLFEELQSTAFKRIVVIGNIHQHPDLLK